MYIYEGYQLLIYFFVSIFVVAFCFIVTYLFGIPKEAIVENMDEINVSNEKFISPAQGQIIALEDVPDEN